jgi:hypothetical protein
MNYVLCVGTPPTFVRSTECGGVLDMCRQHLDRDQVDTPELCSNKSVVSYRNVAASKTESW